MRRVVQLAVDTLQATADRRVFGLVRRFEGGVGHQACPFGLFHVGGERLDAGSERVDAGLRVSARVFGRVERRLGRIERPLLVVGGTLGGCCINCSLSHVVEGLMGSRHGHAGDVELAFGRLRRGLRFPLGGAGGIERQARFHRTGLGSVEILFGGRLRIGVGFRGSIEHHVGFGRKFLHGAIGLSHPLVGLFGPSLGGIAGSGALAQVGKGRIVGSLGRVELRLQLLGFA